MQTFKAFEKHRAESLQTLLAGIDRGPLEPPEGPKGLPFDVCFFFTGPHYSHWEAVRFVVRLEQGCGLVVKSFSFWNSTCPGEPLAVSLGRAAGEHRGRQEF